jgi:two-component system, OmpR family, phosphate regulon sensor histidine kinase PhoR
MEKAVEKLGSMAKARRQAVVDALVEETNRVMDSTIGYFALMNDSEDVLTMLGWSKSAMGACAMIDKPIVYPIEETGLWGDAVRERKPVVTNDYAGSKKPTKKGYPEGHVKVTRHMNVPVWEGDKIVGVLGVGNKPSAYTEADGKNLEELAKRVWPFIKRARE